MSLTEKIRADLTESMKAKDSARTSTLRMLQSALKYEQIEKGHELSDDEAIAIVQRAVKQRQDSIEQYTSGNRLELAEKERSELEMLKKYLPEQLSEEESEAIVREAILATGAESKKDSGKVMKEVMSKHKGRIDGKKVQEIVGKLLPG